MVHYKQVSKEELEAFLQSFPLGLDRDMDCICEPPQLTYNDFSVSKPWPDSIVAKVVLHSAMWPIPEFAGRQDTCCVRDYSV